ncbi:hypothetical protein HG536_0F00660 [Torulaspora globosa]|uniref:Choline/carnitine acyltransferase domain-containing protein n=1 Tax=Torulaspora globosa TaxID=48254 RepID=A0A7G3ZJQ5_9SACH|nr:uncharacterized protein HG536_0F00660 [Torulaspora globosa]QLL33741.1 hypothetical protein HG536_0F00660 [Torulaspora globosa]
MSAVSMSSSKVLEENVGTFTYEQDLPKLPLPEVKRTLEEFERSLQPLYCSDGFCNRTEAEQLREFAEGVDEFSRSEVAEKLQSKLREFDAENDCYLDNIHLDINNNTFRDEQDDLLPRNPFLVLADDAQPGISQADRSAVLVYSALRFVSALRHGVLPPDVNARSGRPLSMRAYKNLFGTTRCPVFTAGEVENFDLEKPYSESDLDEIWQTTDDEDDAELSSLPPSIDQSIPGSPPPGVHRDVFTRHGITLKNYPESKHILVISKGQYYTLDVLDGDDDLIYNVSSLASVFDFILEDSHEPYTFKKSTALGSLTSYSFRNWKYARKRLQKKYPDELRMIDSALFVLVLDQSFPSDSGNETISPTTSEDCKRLFYGTSVIDERGHQVGSCISRWYDKLQLIVTADSKAAVIWDSFTCDGSIVLRFTSETYTESVLRLARDVNAGDPRFSLWPSVKESNMLASANSSKTETDLKSSVKKIVWDFSHILNTHVHLSETKLADLISKHDIFHVSIPFGRRSAQRLGINPDSMVQVALQVAHYALYGRMVYGLEPISTRGYKNSRSCFINIQSMELLELCQEFISNSVDESGKLRKFREACEIHSDKIKKAKLGDSHEKHYNALRYLYKFHEYFGINLDSNDKRMAEQVFDNSLVTSFSAPELIVANCGNAATTTFGITPAVSQGFGIGYIIKDDQCDLTVTSQFRQGGRLMYMLNWVLSEIRAFWKNTNESSYNKAGVKISPVIDKLYEMDNALNNLKSSRKNGSSKVIRGYGFFDMHGHMDSRSSSRINSQSNSSVHLSDMTSNVSLNNGSLHIPKHSSAALSVPTDKEKQDTGYEIQQIQPIDKNESDEDMLFTESRTATRRRNNVINSKFEIDFDRSGVGRKVEATFD